HRARMPVMTPVEQATLATAPDESALDRAVLAASLARLPDAQREILLLRYFGELDYAELATLLAIPKGTVMSRLHQARKALATLIVPEEPRP
ncbi:MAG TPA: sigma-70 family RNA polymerase sigma factor, partial [Sphingobium sp.]|nr:sigma-70 family RNA polymerase sigma factor [Sphingobium sp.]